MPGLGDTERLRLGHKKVAVAQLWHWQRTTRQTRNLATYRPRRSDDLINDATTLTNGDACASASRPPSSRQGCDRTVQNGSGLQSGAQQRARRSMRGHSSQSRSSQKVAGKVLKNLSGLSQVVRKYACVCRRWSPRRALGKSWKRSAVI